MSLVVVFLVIFCNVFFCFGASWIVEVTLSARRAQAYPELDIIQIECCEALGALKYTSH